MHTLRRPFAALAFAAIAALGVWAAIEKLPEGSNYVPPSVLSGAGGLLISATKLEIYDSWHGFGCDHTFAAILTASGGAFTGNTVLSVKTGKHANGSKVVTISAADIVTLEKAMTAAHARMAAKTGSRPKSQREKNNEMLRRAQSGWTDDYPWGYMTFTGPAGTHSIRFTDQLRRLQWVHDGKEEDLDVDQRYDQKEKSEIWKAYSAVLEAADLQPWKSQLCTNISRF